MSWSVSAIGTPKGVAQALKDYAGKITYNEESRREYENVLPTLVAAVEQNTDPVSIVASGSRAADGSHSYLAITLQQVGHGPYRHDPPAAEEPASNPADGYPVRLADGEVVAG